MREPRLFRKRPIEAWQLTADNADAVAAWCGGRVVRSVKPSDPTDMYVGLDIPTLEGTMRAETTHPSTWDGVQYWGGSWVIRGMAGEFYPCAPDIFEQTYEVADDE